MVPLSLLIVPIDHSESDMILALSAIIALCRCEAFCHEGGLQNVRLSAASVEIVCVRAWLRAFQHIRSIVALADHGILDACLVGVSVLVGEVGRWLDRHTRRHHFPSTVLLFVNVMHSLTYQVLV